MISVIIPIYNSEAYLSECLDSVLGQTYKDWECILINDGSTDSSSKIVDFYCSKDSRFRAIHQDNHGVSFARNAGIELSQGECIAYVDSDDWLEDEYLEKLYLAYLQSHSDLSVCGMQKEFILAGSVDFSVSSKVFVLDVEHELDFIEVNKQFLLFGPVIKLYKSSIIKEHVIRFKENCSYGEDLLFNYDYLRYVNKISVISDVLYHYRSVSSLSLSSIVTRDKFALNYNQWHVLYSFFLSKGFNSANSMSYLHKRLWDIVYDGVFVAPYLENEKLSYLKEVLSIPEINNLKHYFNYPAYPLWIRKAIVYRAYILFYLRFLFKR